MVDIEKIRSLAKMQDMSLTELEEQAGLANGTIGKWSSSSPRISSIEKVANVLKVQIQELLILQQA